MGTPSPDKPFLTFPDAWIETLQTIILSEVTSQFQNFHEDVVPVLNTLDERLADILCRIANGTLVERPNPARVSDLLAFVNKIRALIASYESILVQNTPDSA